MRAGNPNGAAATSRHLRFRHRTGAGFTLMEMVVVLLLAGILAFVAMPRFFSSSSFLHQGFQQQAAAAFRYAHKLSIASGCDTRVQLGAGGVALMQRDGCTGSGDFSVNVPRPGGASSFSEAPPMGLAPGSATVYFDSLGQPHDSDGSLRTSKLCVAVGSRNLTVEAYTGYVHLLAACGDLI